MYLLVFTIQCFICLADDAVPHYDSQSHTVASMLPVPLWKQNADDLMGKAKSGDAYAQAVLSFNYHIGLDIKKDNKESYIWAMRSYEKGNPIGGFVLGLLYIKGRIAEKSIQNGLNVLCVWSAL